MPLNSGIQAHPTLSPALTDANGNPVQLNFTATEKTALVAFLKTLTDSTIVNDIKFSDPFITSFTFLGTVDDKFEVGGNWDVGFPPPNDFGGLITIQANCVILNGFPFYLGAGGEFLIENNSILEIR